MTDETLCKAIQIKTDIKVLKSQGMHKEASDELVKLWEEWAMSQIVRLSKEYQEL